MRTRRRFSPLSFNRRSRNGITRRRFGFGFEHYDGIGLWRIEEGGTPTLATGEVLGSADANGAFDGAVELAQRLSTSEQVRSCVVSQWFRYGYGRPSTTEDACTQENLEVSFKSAGYDIKELLVALTQTDAFRYRKVVVAGN